MEFKSVIIVDFFAELPSSLQKPWRDLLLNRYKKADAFQQAFPLVEVQLKLLYTAVTRCIEQLFFAETSSSVSGDAAVRWLTTKSILTPENRSEALATINNVKDLESMSMTNDEFCVVGLDNAELAESAELVEYGLDYLERAIYCFKKAHNPELVIKANVHFESMRLRNRLMHMEDSMSMPHKDSIEKEVSRTVYSLLKENLIAESLNLVDAYTRFLPSYTQQKLKYHLVSSLDVLNIN
jgi:hypothetical protein